MACFLFLKRRCSIDFANPRLSDEQRFAMIHSTGITRRPEGRQIHDTTPFFIHSKKVVAAMR